MKEKSLMIVIPERKEDINPQLILKRLADSQKIKAEIVNEVGTKPSDLSPGDNETIFGTEKEEKAYLVLTVEIESRKYTVNVDYVNVDIPDFFVSTHCFSDLDFEKINEMDTGLSIEIEYTDEYLASYHDQLKLIECFVPDKLAVMDIPSEKMLSGKWVSLAADSNVPPSPKYLFSVQAISGEEDDDEIWLHSHGLKRCGLPDLEILGSSRDMYSTHYSIIETVAVRMIENEEAPNLYEPIFLAWLTDEAALVATLVTWETGLKYYPDVKLGTVEDRDEYHSEGTTVIMVYPGPDDADEEKPDKVQIFDEYLLDNPMFMISSSETARMRNMACERIEYMKKAFEMHEEDNHILLKIGLHVDKEFLDPEEPPENQREHIWFELMDIKNAGGEDRFVCKLTQEPYYVKSMKTGSIGEYDISDITDWIIITKERHYSPDDAYMM